MVLTDYYAIVSKNTTTAITLKKYLEPFYEIAIMPTLREISDSCSISLRVQPKDIVNVVDFIKRSDVSESMYDIYKIGKEDGALAIELYGGR